MLVREAEKHSGRSRGEIKLWRRVLLGRLAVVVRVLVVVVRQGRDAVVGDAENVGGCRERQEAGPREKRKAKAEEKQREARSDSSSSTTTEALAPGSLTNDSFSHRSSLFRLSSNPFLLLAPAIDIPSSSQNGLASSSRPPPPRSALFFLTRIDCNRPQSLLS